MPLGHWWWNENTTTGWTYYGTNTVPSYNFYSTVVTATTKEPPKPKERDRKNLEALRRQEMKRRICGQFKAPVSL